MCGAWTRSALRGKGDMDRRYRRYGRIQLSDMHMLSCEGVGRTLEGKVSVLGLGGMFTRTGEALPPGEALRVRVQGSDAQLEAESVVRNTANGGMGVEFVEMQKAQTANLQSLLRNLKIREVV